MSILVHVKVESLVFPTHKDSDPQTFISYKYDHVVLKCRLGLVVRQLAYSHMAIITQNAYVSLHIWRCIRASFEKTASFQKYFFDHSRMNMQNEITSKNVPTANMISQLIHNYAFLRMRLKQYVNSGLRFTTRSWNVDSEFYQEVGM